MLLPPLSTRLFARHGASVSYLSLRRAQILSFGAATRSFSISHVALEPAAKTAAEEAETDGGASKPRSPAKEKTKKTKETAASKSQEAAEKKKAVKKAEKPKPTKIKITKKDKPPKKPSPPWTQFMAKFAADRHGEVQNVTEMAKEASLLWKQLSDQEKQPYVDEYHRRKVEYEKAYKEYSWNVDPAIVKELNARRAKKGLKKIRIIKGEKRPPSAFFRFVIARRSTLGIKHASIKEAAAFSKECGEAWKELSDAERQVYKDAFEKDVKEWAERQKEHAAASTS